jgi:serine/threonine protein kinase
MHELDFEAGLVSAPDLEAEEIATKREIHIEYKFSGGTRESGLVNTLCADGDGDCSTGNRGANVILKTLRWPVVHDEVVYNHQRIDALASERLTSSPHVVNIYGFYGVSALNEFADGGNFRNMFLQTHYNMTDKERLVYARDAALGLADVHEIDGPNNKTSLVHHDFSAKNLVTVNGKLKVSDFNDGQLSRWNTKTNKRCFGFNWDGLCGTNTERTNRRAPEECRGDNYRRLTSEKVEVYHLGVLFFALLSGEEWPYYFERTSKGVRHKPSSSKVKDLILAGKQPTLPLEIEESNSTVIKGIAHAMREAFKFNPETRSRARKIANFLVEISNEMEGDAQL